MIITFGLTADLLPPHGCKDTTRRAWTDRTLQAWQRAYRDRPNEWHLAFNKVPFAQGSHQIGLVRLLEEPCREPLRAMTADEVRREGRADLLDAADPVAEFVRAYFWKPRKSWDEQTRRDRWEALLNREYVVFRFEFRPVGDRS